VKSIKEYAMSLIKIVLALWIPTIVACPTFDLENLQCETSLGHRYTIEYASLDNNLFSYKVFGIPVEMLLPSQDNHVVTSNTYCSGNQVVTKETFKNIEAISIVEYKNEKLTIKGQSIVTKCDYPIGCGEGKHYFHQFTEEDIVCHL
jgi:hypothetical protein